jgi:hypothetical protein
MVHSHWVLNVRRRAVAAHGRATGRRPSRRSQQKKNSFHIYAIVDSFLRRIRFKNSAAKSVSINFSGINRAAVACPIVPQFEHIIFAANCTVGWMLHCKLPGHHGA